MSEWDFAFGLTGQALEDALSSGATYEEWDIIERELEREIAVGNHDKNVFASSLPSQICSYSDIFFALQISAS